MDWRVSHTETPKRMAILVSRYDHCLIDFLWCWDAGELGAGPIIHQDVAHVTHRDTVDDVVRLGREVECRVLARAVRWHLEDMILVDGGCTVVFE